MICNKIFQFVACVSRCCAVQAVVLADVKLTTSSDLCVPSGQEHRCAIVLNCGCLFLLSLCLLKNRCSKILCLPIQQKCLWVVSSLWLHFNFLVSFLVVNFFVYIFIDCLMAYNIPFGKATFIYLYVCMCLHEFMCTTLHAGVFRGQRVSDSLELVVASVGAISPPSSPCNTHHRCTFSCYYITLYIE